ncbi:Metallophosphoesterase domain protein [Moelleriella libera RCEF 2490]|uniref:Metallophosphoesterase domain protein n=1 Tax=Moelleriella libera RCEF 2490 TaxID=1081109 RepID=A0A167ZL90_9HYPO|nr:Metallophosphoesterase domain protein [Moelleriella libera RCEF 2490]
MKTCWSMIFKRKRRPPRHRVQILSDLHLEVGQQYSTYTFPASAPYLLLGGDIGRLIDYDGYLKFLEAQVSRYEKVFLVLGNHEFYGLDYASGLDEARRLAQEPSLVDALVLLDRTRWDDPTSTLTVVGCTLWSAIPAEASRLIESKINDFKHIDGWTAREHNRVHAMEVSWLREQIAQVVGEMNKAPPGRERQLLVATHHAPCTEGTSLPEDSGNPWTPAFATDLLDQHGFQGVKVWAFGHTHHSVDLMRNGIRLVANQRGYVFPGSVTQQPKGRKPRNTRGFTPEMSIAL